MKERLGGGFTTAVLLLASIPLVTTALSWQIEPVDSGASVGNYCSIAVDDDGRPHISYGRYREARLKYATKSGGSWGIMEVDSSGTWTSIALDDDGLPHISYQASGATRGLKYARLTVTGWELERVDTSPTGVGEFSSLAIDDSGRPHIAYNTGTGANLRYAFFTGTEWLKETVDSIGVVGYYCSIALQSGTTAYISYMNGSPTIDLKLAWQSGGGWQFEMVDTLGNTGFYTSIAIGSNGYPQIAYHATDFNGVRVARWNGSSWTIDTIDPAAQVRGRNSIALDSYGYAHVTYYDRIRNALKYAYWDGAAWNTEKIDDDWVDAGSDNSVAVDRENNVHVAYQGIVDTFSYSYLMYATKPATGVGETGPTSRDSRYMLFQNKPNPCREFTTITYQLPEPGHATLRIYDISGRVVRTLVDERKEAGHNRIRWDGRDGNGKSVPSGIYFYKLQAMDFSQTRKMVLLR